jgi:hypothetical protein
MTGKRTDTIVQLRIDLYDTKRERDELMAHNVLLSQEMTHIRNAAQQILQSACKCHTCNIIREALERTSDR